MKRRHSSDWEEIQDPDQIPQDLEDSTVQEELPDGELYDEKTMWQRPDVASGSTSQRVRSSDQLYNRASYVQDQRVQKDPDRKFYVKRTNRKRLILNTVVTLALVAVAGILGLAIKNQLDLREEILSQPSQNTEVSVESSEQTPESDVPPVMSESQVAPLPSASVEILGSWADRTPVTTAAPPTEAPTQP